MKQLHLWLASGLAAIAMSGCATTSFSPGQPAITNVTENLDGALTYASTFIEWYRQRADETANGRQWFEVIGFLGSFGATVATAGGAGSDAGLAGAAVTTLTGAGNAYYDPRVASGYYRSALSALLCIQQTAVGVKPLEKTPAYIAVNGDDRATFILIKNAVLSVEDALAYRLRNNGSLTDAAALSAEYQTLVEDRLKQTAAASEKAASNPATASAAEKEALSRTFQLQADLQICVLRAKT